MISPPGRKVSYSTMALRSLKLVLPLFCAMCAASAAAQSTQPAAGTLREELTRLIAAGKTEDAVRTAQAALQEQPTDPAIRGEYIDLHLSLARRWLAAGQVAACRTALKAVRAVEPGNPVASRLLEQLERASQRAEQQLPEIDRLLRLELFEPALDTVRVVAALRPDLADKLKEKERAAWLGAADDHYLARNFNEAFALYEHLLSMQPDAAAEIHARWAMSLALALGAADFSKPADPNTTERLLTRALNVLRQAEQPLLTQILRGLLAERAGSYEDAGRMYASATGEKWELPGVDRRRDRVRVLREAAVQRAQELYRDMPVQRRDGPWAVALPNSCKSRQTAHCDVYARNDLIAERVAEACEYHLAGIGAWLGMPVAESWEPRCEIRVHGTQEELHAATGTKGITYAVSHTRVQGERVLLRKLEVFQADPWLLSSTLPHELTHLVLAEMRKSAAPPLVVDEGLALQAEPAARKLMYRRLLPEKAPDATALLKLTQLPADVEAFYAEAGAFTTWLLAGLSQPERRAPTGASAASQPDAALLKALDPAVTTDLPRSLGFESEATMERDWAAWYNALRNPPRMPLMVLAEPAGEKGSRERGSEERD